MVSEFAELHERQFPLDVDVDGVCLGLKRSGKRPVIIVNSRKSPQRRRFTLAHELGHVLIPWHIGSVFDSTIRDEFEEESEYWRMEAEANRFASELLMPSNWVRSLLSDPIDPPALVKAISRQAETSQQSAAYKLAACLPSGFVFAELTRTGMIRPGYSPRTPPSLPYPLSAANIDHALSWASKRWKAASPLGFWWWDTNFYDEVIESDEEWKPLLRRIADDLFPPEDQAAFKASLNGVLAAAHGHEVERTPKKVLSACRQRVHVRAEEDSRYVDLVDHPEFLKFLNARVMAFFRPKKKRAPSTSMS